MFAASGAPFVRRVLGGKYPTSNAARRSSGT
jgi:hypothetical protein